MIQLYPHNQQAVDAVKSHFAKGNRKAAVVHATGTGKSLISSTVALDYSKVLVLAPNNFVLDETRKWMPESVEFCTYMSMMYNFTPENDYDLIVLDEFHRAGAPEWNKGVERLIEANTGAKLLGLSATHVRYLDNNRNMADELFDGNIVSYLGLKDAIDKDILPNPTYVSTIYTIDSEVERITERINKSNNTKDWKEDKLRHLTGIKDSWDKANGVSGIMRKYFHKDMKRIIVFCSKVQNTEEARYQVGKWLAGAGFKRIMFYHIDYTNPNVLKQMSMFQEDDYDGIKVVLSVNMLNEGIHVPRVDGIIMLRTTISRIIIEQQIGRCLTADNKSNPPVVLDLVNNMDLIRYDNKYTFANKEYVSGEGIKDKKESEGFPFKVTDECRDIRIFYEQLEQEIITRGEDIEVHIERMLEWVRENGTILYTSCPEVVWFRDLLRPHRKDRYADVIERIRNYGIQLPSEAFPRLSWDEKFQVFMEWKQEHNGKIPPVDTEIGAWVHMQISYYNCGKLPADRIERVKNEMFLYVMTDDEVIDFLRKAIAEGEDINKYSKGHGEISTFIRKVKTNKYKLQNLDIAIEMYNNGLKIHIPYTFETGYQYVKKYFDTNLTYGRSGGVTIFKNCPDKFIRNWRMQIATKYDQCTPEQQKLLNEIGIHIRIQAPLDVRMTHIEEEFAENGCITLKSKRWLQFNKKKLKEQGMWDRARNVGQLEAGESKEILMARFEEIHKDGRVRNVNELPRDVYNFIHREINSESAYGIRIREFGYKSVKDVIEANKKMFSEWLAENKRIPCPKKKNGKVMKDDVEYKCYVCMTTWSKCKTPELIEFVTTELAKYGLTYKAKGMTIQDYRNEFIRKIIKFRESGCDYFSLHKTDNLFNQIANYRRKAIKDNDTEILELLKSIGALITPEERIAINAENAIRPIAEYLSAGGKMSCQYENYGVLKKYGTSVNNGTIQPYIAEILKKYHFILDDGTFCNYIGKEYNFKV